MLICQLLGPHLTAKAVHVLAELGNGIHRFVCLEAQATDLKKKHNHFKSTLSHLDSCDVLTVAVDPDCGMEQNGGLGMRLG